MQRVYLIAMLELVNPKYILHVSFNFEFTSSSNQYNIFVNLQCTCLFIALQPLFDTDIGNVKIVSPDNVWK